MTECILEEPHVRSNKHQQILDALEELAKIKKRLQELSEAAE
jgi:hypothetical protein